MLCYTALFTAVIAVCGFICVPVGEMKYTLQLLAVLVCGGVLGVKYGSIAVGAYLLLGAVGVPVFSGFSAGLFSSPTSGFLIGFLATVVFTGFGYGFSCKNSLLNHAVHVGCMIIGTAVCYVFGLAWFLLYFSGSHITLAYAFGVCVLPYLLFDGVKIALAGVLIEKLRTIVK